jgi:tripartite ATP-independent transporter DctM subunit
VKLNPKLAPPATAAYSWRDRLASIKGLIPWLMVILLVLGVIFGGIMTSTEAASLGASLSIVLALLYRKMTYKVLKDSFLEAVRVSSALFFIVAMAKVLVYVLQRMGVLEVVTNGVIGMQLGVYGTLIMIYAVYLILGMFFDSISMMMLTLPFFMPVITYLGIDHTWFAIAYVVIAEIGMVTPPFGLNLFVLNSVVPKHSMLMVAYGSIPFIVTCLIFMAMLTAFPQMALWLPNILF